MAENKQQLTLFKVRDLRKKDQFKIDDVYLNGYARVCKPIATAVYNSLCRHAEFNTQKAFPSQGLIAYQHDISVRAVRRGIKKLTEYNIIIVEQERRKGKFMNYIYTLLDKSQWKPINHRTKTTYGEPEDKSAIRRKTIGGKRPTKDNKGFKDNKVLNKDNTKGFDIFWKEYPRKVAKQTAFRSWNRLNPGKKLIDIILKDIAFRKTTDDWLKNNGMYIPHPSTYLNQTRWEDEYKGQVPQKKPYYRGDPMIWSESKKKWFVVCEGGEWKEFAGNENDIEYK